MPELPEVETVVRQLRPHLARAQVRAVRILDARLALPLRQQRRLRGRTVAAVERVGKQIALRLERSRDSSEVGVAPLYMLVHLRMTGRLIFSPTPVPHATKYLRAIFELDRGWLVFQDTRRFG